MNNSTAVHKDISPEFTYPQPKDEITIGDIEINLYHQISTAVI
ncbi:hypothetical protein QUF90_26970 [Desulfococcaceae bacterium HSG9]|nr:hypothetical protein [Desulfococcaceae bacterium HSG9]